MLGPLSIFSSAMRRGLRCTSTRLPSSSVPLSTAEVHPWTFCSSTDLSDQAVNSHHKYVPCDRLDHPIRGERPCVTSKADASECEPLLDRFPCKSGPQTATVAVA